MLDYPSDVDVPMHSSSSESWLLGDLAMEDDPHFHIQKSLVADRSSASVEVDMEDWAGETIEYEMADEDENHHGGDDLLDVEVYDASQVQTPLALDTARILPDVPDHSQSPSLPAHNLSIPMASEIDETPPAAGEGHDDEVIGHPDDTLYSSVVEQTVAASPKTEFRPDILDDASAAVVIAPESAPPPPTDFTEAPEEVPESVSEPVSSTHIPNVSINHDSIHSDRPDASIDSTVVPTPHLLLSGLVASETEHTESVDHDQAHEYHNHGEPEDNLQTSSDPHEISEGVYIDPPPAVLLSFSLPDERELCLFNRPPPKSGSSSPSAGTQPEQPMTMLLHQRPTLYYEPLLSVFKALRQEEEIARIPGFADGELLIDAYDLQLSVSEVRVFPPV